MILEFDHLEEIGKIRSNLKKIEQIRNSLADNTGKYRDFCTDINVDFSVIKEIVNTKSEYSLLIDCYTFSERLLKNVIYECLEFEKHTNDYLNKFMKKKLTPDKFSPNVKFQEFENELKSLRLNYSFLLSLNHSSIKIYNEMVNSRHRYAHANEYPFPYESYKEVIDVLEYLVWETNMFLNQDDVHEKLLENYKLIMEDTKKIKKISCDKKIRYMSYNERKKIDIKDFRDRVRSFEINFGDSLRKVKIFELFIKNIEMISSMNLNNNTGNELSLICKNIGKEFH